MPARSRSVEVASRVQRRSTRPRQRSSPNVATLDQVSLGQLLELYQYSEGKEESALARFVNELLGLEQLDALRAGLDYAGDLRRLKNLSELLDAEERQQTAPQTFSPPDHGTEVPHKPTSRRRRLTCSPHWANLACSLQPTTIKRCVS